MLTMPASFMPLKTSSSAADDKYVRLQAKDSVSSALAMMWSLRVDNPTSSVLAKTSGREPIILSVFAPAMPSSLTLNADKDVKLCSRRCRQASCKRVPWNLSLAIPSSDKRTTVLQMSWMLRPTCAASMHSITIISDKNAPPLIPSCQLAAGADSRTIY